MGTFGADEENGRGVRFHGVDSRDDEVGWYFRVEEVIPDAENLVRFKESREEMGVYFDYAIPEGIGAEWGGVVESFFHIEGPAIAACAVNVGAAVDEVYALSPVFALVEVSGVIEGYEGIDKGFIVHLVAPLF